MICVGGLENRAPQFYAGRMSILSENILALRQRFQTQTDFGEAVGVGQSTVVRWQQGSDPKPDNLLALARIANVSIEQLITVPIADIPASSDGLGLLSAQQLESMVQLAMQELPVGATNEDYRRVVASSLHDQLKQLQAVGGFRRSGGEGSDPDTGAPPPKPTKRGGKGSPRNP